MPGIVVVFDFDKTIIDCDSDNWVIDELGVTELFEQLLPTMPWNPLMDKIMNELHKQGKSIEDITQVLKRTPIHPRIIPAIKAAHGLGCDLKIVSDANIFYIETILKHHGVLELFSEINTNPSLIDEDGRLRIFPHHHFTESPPHPHQRRCSTNLCPPNMCKGMVIEKIQALMEEEKRVIYLGDGIGDFCPSLKLKEKDYLMPRKNYPIWDLISQNQNLIKPEIHQWIDGQDLELVLLHLITTNISIPEQQDNKTNNQHLVSVDSYNKLQNISSLTAH